MRRGNGKPELLREGREAQEAEGGVWEEVLVVLQHPQAMLDLVGKVQ